MTNPANPVDVIDELSDVIDLMEVAAAACGAYSASSIATTLNIASDRLSVLKRAFEALRQSGTGGAHA